MALKLPTSDISRGTGYIAAIRAAPTAPKGIPPSIGSMEAKWSSRLGPRAPESLALLSIGGTTPLHAHSLSITTWLAVPQADIWGALGTVS